MLLELSIDFVPKLYVACSIQRRVDGRPSQVADKA